mmetsp:Transcript_6986/g.29667  ORF Transcript_6986/g.29667 Transcript_6986/m.29667 type:complete len:469 (+) Transcript_6986:195-1601(+)
MRSTWHVACALRRCKACSSTPRPARSPLPCCWRRRWGLAMCPCLMPRHRKSTGWSRLCSERRWRGAVDSADGSPADRRQIAGGSPATSLQGLELGAWGGGPPAGAAVLALHQKPGPQHLAGLPTAPSAALPHVAAGGAEIAAVLVDHGCVAALRAGLAGLHLQRTRRGRELRCRRLQQAHVAQRLAGLVEDAEHRVAVDHQPRHVGHGGRPDLLAALDAQAGDRRHEMAQRLAHIEQLAQLHRDPAGVHHAHVERQQARQAVERLGVVAGEAHRTGPRHRATVGRGQHHLLERQRELLVGGRVVHVHRPGQRAVHAGAGLVAAEHRVDHRCGPALGQRTKLLAAPADDGSRRGDDAGEEALFAARRHGHLEGALLGHGGQRVELEAQPRGVVGAQVGGQGLGQGRQPARLLGAVDPHLERQVAAEQPAVRAVQRQLADEEREVAMRMLDQIAPGRVAAGHLGPAGPAQ